MQDFRKLKAWQVGHELTLHVYRTSSEFPAVETYGLTSQIRRAAASIPTNIAEGCGRDGKAELARFLHIAAGSANEVQYLLLLARDLKYLAEPTYAPLAGQSTDVKRMLTALIQAVKHPTGGLADTTDPYVGF